MREPLTFSGIMPANILPFNADLSVDEHGTRPASADVDPQ